jgi:hypothetical protein
VMYLICTLYFCSRHIQFDQYKIGDRYGNVIGRCHYAYIYILVLFV